MTKDELKVKKVNKQIIALKGKVNVLNDKIAILVCERNAINISMAENKKFAKELEQLKDSINSPDQLKKDRSIAKKIRTAIKTCQKKGIIIADKTDGIYLDKFHKIKCKGYASALETLLLNRKVDPVIVGEGVYYDNEATVVKVIGRDQNWIKAFQAGYNNRPYQPIHTILYKKAFLLGKNIRKTLTSQSQAKKQGE